tara:strand:- start:624 stop:860 length:237 start_codon:yes stop_codon:yes gene_type:complete
MIEENIVDECLGDKLCEICGKIIPRKEVDNNTSIHEKCSKNLQNENKKIFGFDCIYSSEEFNSDETDDFMSVYGDKES